MSQVIRIPDELYNRLGLYASGFETPASVIERILDLYEQENPNADTGAIKRVVPVNEMKPATKLEICYLAGSEVITDDQFKQKLLQEQNAFVKLHYTNGESEIKEWNAKNFKASSRLDGNLRSGYLRGWKERGIFKAELAIDREELE